MAYQPDPHLVFKEPASKVTSHLVFGEYDAPASATAKVSLVLRLDPVRLLAQIGYDNNVFRDPAPSLTMGFEAAGAQRVELAAPLIVASVVAVESESRLTLAETAETGLASPLWPSPAISAVAQASLTPADALCASADQALQAGIRITAQTGAIFTAAEPLGDIVSQPLEWGLRAGLDITTGLTPANQIGLGFALPCHEAAILIRVHETWAQPGMQPKPGRSWIDPGINPPMPVCYTPSAKLVFQDKGRIDAHLVFICDNASSPSDPLKVIPIQRSYIVINSVSLKRADDGSEVIAASLSVGIDADSWAWSWDAQINSAQLDAVMPGSDGAPVELRATINGSPFLLLAERISRERSFGKSSLRVSGRGISALLAAPYFARRALRNDVAMDMEQLAEVALTENGVGIGWTLDWQAADWLVPAGLWATTATPVEALVALAQSAGAYVQPARNSKLLRVLPRYAIAPWDWSASAPALQIPDAVFTTESIEWVEKARYNAVYVSGQGTGGLLGLAKRDGTAGDVLAQMITDPLVTDAAAVRARGLPVLADTGRQALVSGTMPVLDGVGIIDVGTLVQLGSGASARRGLVRSVKVAAGFPRVRQTLEVECHG